MGTSDPLAALSAAIASNDVSAVRKVLGENPGMDLEAELPGGAFGATALLQAVYGGNVEMIDALLDAGADPDGRSHWWAGSFGVLDGCRPELAGHLIARGATVTAHAAARLNMPDRLKELVAADRSVVHARGGDGQTPLHFAATVPIAEFLVDAGADIDARCVDHESTPAMWMVRDRTDVARYLVSRGCETDILLAAAVGDMELVKKHLAENPASIRLCVRDEDFPRKNPRAASVIYLWTLGAGQTPHSVAAAFGHREVAEYLVKQSPPEMQFVAACLVGDEATVKRLLAENPGAAKSLTPGDAWHLGSAARNNDATAVKLMLACGFPVDASGPYGGTALHWSAWHGNLDAVQALLQHHPDLTNTVNEFKATSIGWALHGSQNSWHRKTGNYPAVVKALLDAGAPVPDVRADSTLDPEVLAAVRARRPAP